MLSHNHSKRCQNIWLLAVVPFGSGISKIHNFTIFTWYSGALIQDYWTGRIFLDGAFSNWSARKLSHSIHEDFIASQVQSRLYRFALLVPRRNFTLSFWDKWGNDYWKDSGDQTSQSKLPIHVSTPGSSGRMWDSRCDNVIRGYLFYFNP